MIPSELIFSVPINTLILGSGLDSLAMHQMVTFLVKVELVSTISEMSVTLVMGLLPLGLSGIWAIVIYAGPEKSQKHNFPKLPYKSKTIINKMTVSSCSTY